jgi:outer membrane protein assembly factor BamE
MKRLALPALSLLAAALLSSGCVYRMTIQQGNYLVTDSVAQLKEGMTRSQVRFLLGTPMVPDAFSDDRWDYYYFLSSRLHKDPLKRRLTVYFADEKVQRIENIGVPTQADLQEMERDLQRAIAATKNNDRKRGFFSRLFRRDAPASSPAPAPTSSDSPAGQAPDPVPPSQPLPEPAGTPSGPP